MKLSLNLIWYICVLKQISLEKFKFIDCHLRLIFYFTLLCMNNNCFSLNSTVWWLSSSLPSSCFTSSDFIVCFYIEHNRYCIRQTQINCLSTRSSIQYQLHFDACTGYLDVCHRIVLTNGNMEKIRILDSMGWPY